MNAGDIDGHRLWAYIHGELDSESRQGLDRALAGDPGLRQRLTSLQDIDRQMRKLMPLAGQSEEALEQAVLKAWEEATRPIREEPSLAVVWAGIRRRVAARPAAPRVVRLVLAAAACLVLLVGTRNFMQGPVEWSETQIALGPSFRGADGKPAAVPHREKLEQGAVILRNGIVTRYESAAPERSLSDKLLGRKTWELAARIEPLPPGKVLVEIVAAPRAGGRPEREWSRVFANADAFAGEAAMWATEIAEMLAGETPAPQPLKGETP